tara:strand:- start:715 stop:1149 length:435 start_codon:yes stop_codon:yes gene_type:complete
MSLEFPDHFRIHNVYMEKGGKRAAFLAESDKIDATVRAALGLLSFEITERSMFHDWENDSRIIKTPKSTYYYQPDTINQGVTYFAIVPSHKLYVAIGIRCGRNLGNFSPTTIIEDAIEDFQEKGLNPFVSNVQKIPKGFLNLKD